MTTQLSRPAISNTITLYEQATTYWLSLWDKQTGGFRFAPHQPATLMATAYCVLGLEFTKGLSRLSTAQKDSVISFLMTGSQPDGSFSDPLFRVEDIVSSNHGLSYFQEETITFCQQALDALQAPPPPARIYDDNRNTVTGIIQFCESLAWQDAWLDSNPVMFALSQLCHDAKRHQKPELLETVDTALDWLDKNHSPETGLWQGPHQVPLTNAMAATFHFTFFYGYRNRPLQYVDRIIDSCLKLQESHGLFCGNSVGQTCLDYDAIDLLAKASQATNYRSDDVHLALKKANKALLELHNPDGGFANCKEMVRQFSGPKSKLVKALGLSPVLSLFSRIPATGNYNVCWQLLSCETVESNAFSTWFRLLGISLAMHQDRTNNFQSGSVRFRQLPFLGFHTW